MLYFLSFILVVSKHFLVLSFSWFLGKQPAVFFSCFKKCRIFFTLFETKKGIKRPKNAEERKGVSLLDLPDLPLECIFERLSPTGLCSTAGVCRSLRESCTSDYFWEKHMKQKWGGVIGPAAYQKWQSHVALQKKNTILKGRRRTGVFDCLQRVGLQCRVRSKENHGISGGILLNVNSVMAWYLSLETGKFWFPAQVFNREVQNGHVGFMLSCYDAEVCYDFRTDTFKARYSARGGQTMEENIEWSRLRKPAINTPADVLHVSDCLGDLKPDDHIEIQWRRCKEFPYGWWYGVVGHLEQCHGEKFYCQCHLSDTAVLEFKQYAPGSRWRKIVINRKKHREVGNEVDGFYGGIRKLVHEEEVSVWKSLWPTSILE